MPTNPTKSVRSIRFYVFRLANFIQKSDFFPRRLRPALLRLAGLNIGNVRIQPSVNFLAGEISIADGAYINTGALIDATAPVTIGSKVFIAPRVNIITATHEIGDADMRAGGRAPSPITIEDGVWIGTAASILPGVTIAKGCVVAAGAVVTKCTATNGLYAGVPAKRIKELPVT